MGFIIDKNFGVNQVTEDDFLKAFGEPLQKFKNNTEEIVQELEETEKETDYFENEQTEQTNTEDKRKIKKFNVKTSKTIVSLVDKFFAFALSIYSLSENIDDYKIDQDDFDELVEYISLMLPDDKKVFPLWLQLTITASMTWSPLIMKAHRDRKETIELRDQRQKNEEHELKIRELELKLKEKEIEKKE